MTRTLLPILVFLVACETPTRNQPARAGEDSEGVAPLSVHPSLDGAISYVKHTSDRLDDGRMTFKLVIANEHEVDLVLVARTDWYDIHGDIVERGAAHPIVIAAGQTFIYEDTSFSPRATRFAVSVRPANTERVAE